MSKQRIAALIQQEVQKPTADGDNKAAIATTQNTPLANLQLTSQGLFEESKPSGKSSSPSTKSISSPNASAHSYGGSPKPLANLRLFYRSRAFKPL